MRKYNRAAIWVTLLATVVSPTLVMGQQAPWRPVTPERIQNPEDGDWLSYRRTYDGVGYSPLKQIDKANVSQLRPVWSFSIPESSRWFTTPIVANGRMYLAEGGGRVRCLDAVTGDPIWVHERSYPDDVGLSQGFNRARGLAIYDDVLYWGTADMNLLAVDARTGKLLWETKTGDYHDGSGHSHPPLVADGKVFLGMAGGDRSAPGRFKAFDAKTGKFLWEVKTAPENPGDPGYESWPKDRKYPILGAAPWNTITYDPELKLVYFGTGQPTPWSSAVRGPGDALFGVSALAVDATTGKIRWHYQMVPADDWDRAVYEPMLVDLDIKGKRRKAMILTNKIGWGAVLDRGTGEFLHAFKTAYDNTVTGWTAKGRPIRTAASIPKPEDVASGKVFEICPHPYGARNIQSPSYSAATGLYYVGINNSCSDMTIQPVDYRPGVTAIGMSFTAKMAPGYDYVGEFVAFNPVTGQKAWSYRTPRGEAMTASALATDGAVVFGGTADREFFALDSANGQLLWRTRLNGDVSGSPITYQVDDRQYVAVPAGGRNGLATTLGALSNIAFSDGAAVINVFALPAARDMQPPARTGSSAQPAVIRSGAPAAGSGSASAAQVGAQTGPAANGLFTSEQAIRGQQVFTRSCSSCHSVTDQAGGAFRAKWAGAGGLGQLFKMISISMPLNAPGRLPKEEYAAVIAFLLRQSGYPAGASPLPADGDALAKLVLTGGTGKAVAPAAGKDAH